MGLSTSKTSPCTHYVSLFGVRKRCTGTRAPHEQEGTGSRDTALHEDPRALHTDPPVKSWGGVSEIALTPKIIPKIRKGWSDALRRERRK